MRDVCGAVHHGAVVRADGDVRRAVPQVDPENKPSREELKEEVLAVAKGLRGLGGFNLVRSVSIGRDCRADVGVSFGDP